MTRAPATLLAVRRLLLDHLNIDASRVRADDLEPAEVGIVGSAAHQATGTSYHLGEKHLRMDRAPYSVVESTRDRTGLTDDAAALDVGMFQVRAGGRTHDLFTFSTWCVQQCISDAPDTRDIREIICSPDGKVVRRWDRLGRRTSGDSSHLWHTHFSFFRDAIRARRDQTPLFRRYLTTIGLLEDDDMTPEEHAWLETVHRNLTVLDGRNPIGQIYTRMAMGEDHTGARMPAHPSLRSLAAQLSTMQTAVLGAVGGLDTAAILARVDEHAAAEAQRDAAAAAERAALAAQLVDLADLVRRAEAGELTAIAVLAELKRLLPDVTPVDAAPAHAP